MLFERYEIWSRTIRLDFDVRARFFLNFQIVGIVIGDMLFCGISICGGFPIDSDRRVLLYFRCLSEETVSPDSVE